MTTKEQLVDQHFREYHSRLKHIDELAEKAEQLKHVKDSPELVELKVQRDKFAAYLHTLKQDPSKELMESAGPLALWDVVAQSVEKLVAKVDKK